MKTPPGIAQNLSEATQNVEHVQRLGIAGPTAQLTTNLDLAIRALERAKSQIRAYKRYNPDNSAK